MLIERKHKDIVWYSFLKSKKEEILPIFEKNNIDNYFFEKFTKYTNRDKVLVSGNYIFISLTFPNLKDEDYERQTIKFIVGKNNIFTIQETANEGLDYFTKIFESSDSFEKKNKNDPSVAFIFLHMIEKIYENTILELIEVREEIDNIESNIFKEKEKEMVKQISLTNRKLINFHKNLKSHQETWNMFFNVTESFFERKDVFDALQSITLSYSKTIDNIEQLKELLWELRDTNNSLLQSKQNQSAIRFTLIAFFVLPVSLFIDIMSVPTYQEHFLGQNYDFYFILFISFMLFGIALFISKWKKWW